MRFFSILLWDIRSTSRMRYWVDRCVQKIGLVFRLLLLLLPFILFNCCDRVNTSKADAHESATHHFYTLKNNIYYLNLDSAARTKYLIKISNGEYSNAQDVENWLSSRLSQIWTTSEGNQAYTLPRIVLDSIRSDSLRYRIYKNLGGILLSKDKNTEAAELYRSALDLADQINNPEMQLGALTGIAKTHVNLLQYDSAVYVFEEAEKLASLNNDLQNQLPDLYNGIAACHNYLGNYLVAINKFVDAAKLYQANGDTAKLGMVYHNIGTSFLYLKRYEKAIDYFNQSLAINQNTQKKQSSLIDFVNLGIAYEYLDSFAKAASCHEQGQVVWAQTHR